MEQPADEGTTYVVLGDKGTTYVIPVNKGTTHGIPANKGIVFAPVTQNLFSQPCAANLIVRHYSN